MIEIKAQLHKILPAKRTRNEHYVIPVIVKYDIADVPQYRYMQAVNNYAKNQMVHFREGDDVVLTVNLKGKEISDKFYNLDEITAVERMI